MMNRITHLTLVFLFASLLAACSAGAAPIPVTGGQPALQLSVGSPDGENAFRQGEEPITYNYVVTNTGTLRLSGPVMVDDPPRQVACPQLSAVGNQDEYLDQNESVTCTAYYTLSEAERGAGSLTNRARALVGGAVSNETGITLGPGTGASEGGSQATQVPATPAATQGTGELSLVTNASPQSFAQAGDTITYSYLISNTGDAPVGPAQFTIRDSRLGEPFNCGPADTTLVPGQTLTCSAAYTVTEADLSGNLTSSATASGGGQTSAPVSTTVTSLAAPAASPTAFADASPSPDAAATSSPVAPAAPTSSAGTASTASAPGSAASPGTVNVVDVPAGADSVLLAGVAPAGGSIRYSVRAAQGQELLLNFVITTNQLVLTVTAPDGSVIKPPEAGMPWRSSLAAGGDYLIDVLDTSGIEAQPYMLELRLSP